MLGLAQRRRAREARSRAEFVAALREATTAPAAKRWQGWVTARSVTWRLRKQLAPLGVIGGLWLAAVLVDAGDVPAGAVLLLGILVAVALWRLRYTTRLDRAVERVYAVTCLAGGVAWLTLAAALGLA